MSTHTHRASAEALCFLRVNNAVSDPPQVCVTHDSPSLEDFSVAMVIEQGSVCSEEKGLLLFIFSFYCSFGNCVHIVP